MQYAPVIIPTLNRYDHFKRCLESLERCTGANNTEVYVGLDYPPAEKYIEGWKKIDEYLKEKEQNNGFAKLVVKRRDQNLGICNPSSNGNTLLKEIPEDTGCYIFTEDDNEFAPAFLDFMNKALHEYENDPKVYGVCGFTPLGLEKLKGNIAFTKTYSAWGAGLWKQKCIDRSNSKQSFESILGSPLKVIKLFFRSPGTLAQLSYMTMKGLVWGDVIDSTYNILFNQFQIRSTKPLVFNNGYDGTGQHCNDNNRLAEELVTRGLFQQRKFPLFRVNKFSPFMVWINDFFGEKPRSIKNSMRTLYNAIRHYVNYKKSRKI